MENLALGSHEALVGLPVPLKEGWYRPLPIAKLVLGPPHLPSVIVLPLDLELHQDFDSAQLIYFVMSHCCQHSR